jgi:transposase
VFFDEFGFSFLEGVATTWARKGKRPVLRRVARDRRVLSSAVALTMSGKIYKRHFEGSIKSDLVILTLEHLQRHLPGKIILILDRARTHKSQKTQAFLDAHPEILVEELPAYAPELNPEEYCHGNVKHHLKNARLIDKTQMRQLLNGGFARLRRRPDLLLSFFHAAGLSVRQLQLT